MEPDQVGRAAGLIAHFYFAWGCFRDFAAQALTANRFSSNPSCFIAFSSEVDAGSREENASKQKPGARF